MPQKQPDLTIVIPALSEGKRIGKTLDTLAAFLTHDDFLRGKSVEVLVAAADASDKTDEIALSKQLLFSDLTLLKPGAKAGKGRDVQFGMLRASGKYILFMDADLATPLHHIETFYRACEHGSDIAIGTRNLANYRPNPLRRFVSGMGNVLFRIAGGVWVEDSQCGFKMFTYEAAQLCFSQLKIMGWQFDMEILAIAKANHLKITSYRIDDWRDMPYSTFTQPVPLTIIYSFGDLLRIVVKRLLGAYRAR